MPSLIEVPVPSQSQAKEPLSDVKHTEEKVRQEVKEEKISMRASRLLAIRELFLKHFHAVPTSYTVIDSTHTSTTRSVTPSIVSSSGTHTETTTPGTRTITPPIVSQNVGWFGGYVSIPGFG